MAQDMTTRVRCVASPFRGSLPYWTRVQRPGYLQWWRVAGDQRGPASQQTKLSVGKEACRGRRPLEAVMQRRLL